MRIGDKFKIAGKEYKAVEDEGKSCSNCDMQGQDYCFLVDCLGQYGGNSVIFKLVDNTNDNSKQKAIDILEEYNKWRRGADIEMLSPKDIGKAIDFAIKYLKDE